MEVLPNLIGVLTSSSESPLPEKTFPTFEYLPQPPYLVSSVFNASTHLPSGNGKLYSSLKVNKSVKKLFLNDNVQSLIYCDFTNF